MIRGTRKFLPLKPQDSAGAKAWISRWITLVLVSVQATPKYQGPYIRLLILWFEQVGDYNPLHHATNVTCSWYYVLSKLGIITHYVKIQTQLAKTWVTIPVNTADKGGGGALLWIFFCCTRSDVAAPAPTLLHPLRRYCTRSNVTAHAPTLLHTLQRCCTRSEPRCTRSEAPTWLHCSDFDWYRAETTVFLVKICLIYRIDNFWQKI